MAFTENSRTVSNEILWYLRSPRYSDLYRAAKLFLQLVITEITSKLTFQPLYSNLISRRGLLQSKFEWNVEMETKH